MSPTTTRSNSNGHNSHGSAFSPVQPKELRLWVGVTFMTIMIAAISAIIALEKLSLKDSGITLPSNNAIVRSIVENFAPTLFATFLEPVWVILNRLLCLLLPFEQLRHGNAKSASSVEAKYTSLPPQLTIVRALRSRHFILASVCLITLLAIVLAVILSALFSERPVLRSIPFSSKQTLSTQLNQTLNVNVGHGFFYQDHFYVALSNITQGTTLPSWSDQNYAYIPFDLNPPLSTNYTKSNFQAIRGSTIGFGTKFTCVEIFPSEGSDTVSIDSDSTKATMQSLGVGGTSNATICKNPILDAPIINSIKSNTYEVPPTRSALEYTDVAKEPSGSQNSTGICPLMILAAFGREGGPEHFGQNFTAGVDRNITSTWISCSPVLQIAPFEVTVDSVGKVIDSKQTGNFVTDVSPFFTNNTNQTAFLKQLLPMIPSINKFGTWHNDTFAANWLSSLLQRSLNTSAIADPNTDTPKASLIAPQMERQFRQLFSTYLAINPKMFLPAPTNTPGMIGEVIFKETRVFVSSVNSEISLAIIALNLLVAIFYYANRPKKFLPRMPTSIASVMAYVAASRAAEDFSHGSGIDEGKGDERFGYGRFVGADGKTYVGVKKQNYVVPLESRNPDAVRWGLGVGWLRKRIGREGDGRQIVMGEKVESWI